MIINKVKIIRNNSVYETDFVNGVNIINAHGNQLGKTTIIYSILFALGAKKEIFKSLDKKPEIVELNVNNFKIIRTKKYWSCNDEIVNSRLELHKLLSINTGRVRTFGNGITEQDLIMLQQFMFLPQARLDFKNEDFFPNLLKAAKNDFLSSLMGFDKQEELIDLSIKIQKIKTMNKKIKKNIKLNEYITTKDQLAQPFVFKKQFSDYDKKIGELRRQIRKNYFEERKNAELINEFADEAEYVSTVYELIDELNKIAQIKNIETTTNVKNFLMDKFSVSKVNNCSISDFEKAKQKNIILEKERGILKQKIKKLKEEAIFSMEKNNLIDDLITHAIAKVTKEDIKSYQEEKLKLEEIKKEREEFINQVNVKTENIMSKNNIALSDSGLGQVAKFIIDRTSWKNKLNIPMIIDSFEEMATNDNLLNKIMPLINDFSGQSILTATNVKNINNANIIHLKDKFFN